VQKRNKAPRQKLRRRVVAEDATILGFGPSQQRGEKRTEKGGINCVNKRRRCEGKRSESDDYELQGKLSPAERKR